MFSVTSLSKKNLVITSNIAFNGTFCSCYNQLLIISISLMQDQMQRSIFLSCTYVNMNNPLPWTDPPTTQNTCTHTYYSCRSKMRLHNLKKNEGKEVYIPYFSSSAHQDVAPLLISVCYLCRFHFEGTPHPWHVKSTLVPECTECVSQATLSRHKKIELHWCYTPMYGKIFQISRTAKNKHTPNLRLSWLNGQLGQKICQEQFVKSRLSADIIIDALFRLIND